VSLAVYRFQLMTMVAGSMNMPRGNRPRAARRSRTSTRASIVKLLPEFNE
jgi:hypothetical protein